MNKVILYGNMGKDAETKGKRTSFSLATNETWNDKESGEKQTKTTWHNVVMWNASDGLIPYLVKGTKLIIEGKIDNRSYEADDGVTKYTSEVVVDWGGGLTFAGGGATQSQVEEPAPPSDDDIPF